MHRLFKLYTVSYSLYSSMARLCKLCTGRPPSNHWITVAFWNKRQRDRRRDRLGPAGSQPFSQSSLMMGVLVPPLLNVVRYP